MPKALFDFTCNLGHTDERYVDVNLQESICSICGGVNKKEISSPSYFKMGKFRTEILGDEWARRREKNAKRVRERDGD